MKFEALKSRVERAETLVEGRLQQTSDRYGALKSSWRDAWTPGRIVIAGLIAGFVTGRSEPRHALQKLGKLGGPKSIQLVSSIAGMLTSMQAAFAAMTAEKAANTADAAASDAQDAAETVQQEAGAPVAAGVDAAAAAGAAAGAAAAAGTRAATTPVGVQPQVQPDLARADRRRPEPAYAEQPRPAEAATDVSESDR
ncbi:MULTISPECIES: hypothetical protein [Luteimonas]|uniref:hypothetical protein n=1 Tax=Luteimonas TaxID=83614 RepID=UPI0018ED7E41|nr:MULTISPECIES: hypothetical protein [Luteimonas]